jgi:hypothetical protein
VQVQETRPRIQTTRSRLERDGRSRRDDPLRPRAVSLQRQRMRKDVIADTENRHRIADRRDLP